MSARRPNGEAAPARHPAVLAVSDLAVSDLAVSDLALPNSPYPTFRLETGAPWTVGGGALLRSRASSHCCGIATRFCTR